MTRNYIVSISHLFKHVLNIDAQNTEEGRAKVNEILSNKKLSLDDLHYEGTLSEDKWDFIEKKDLVKHIIENKK